jgi:hypothetical protein
MRKRAGQTRNTPIRRAELWIRNVIKSSVAIVTAQKMQTVSANESKLMTGKLAINVAMASWLTECCVEVS